MENPSSTPPACAASPGVGAASDGSVAARARLRDTAPTSSSALVYPTSSGSKTTKIAASHGISSLPSPSSSTAAAAAAVAAAATAQREAIREGERRTRAQIVPMPTASTRPSSAPSFADPPPPSPSATAAIAANREAIREGKRRKQTQTEGDDILSAGKRKVSTVKRARAQTAK